MSVVVASLLLALPVLAQGESAKPLAPPPAAKQSPPPREAPTFEKLHLDAAELPAGWALAPEIRCVSTQAATLLEPGLYDEAVKQPKRRDFQTLTAPGAAGAAVAGSILYFEYEKAIPAEVLEFVTALLWGHDGKPSKAHPEQPLRVGNVLVILSFPEGAPQPTWIAERLRRRFGVRLRHDVKELRPLFSQLQGAYQRNDPEAGLALLRDSSAKVASSSLAAYMEGEFSMMKKDWAGAEKGYARALELDATVDPLPEDGTAHAATDGLGIAQLQLKKLDEAVKTLREAARMAAELARPKEQGHALYNVACGLALLGKPDDAIATLAQSFKLADDLKAHSKTDHDLDSLRELPAFKKLME